MYSGTKDFQIEPAVLLLGLADYVRTAALHKLSSYVRIACDISY
jgi:hypothetical protein